MTVALNPAMSNAPWSDADAKAAGLGKGKRGALAQSVLLLNAELTKNDAIDEQAIAERGQALSRRAAQIWPRPTPATAAAADKAMAAGGGSNMTRPAEVVGGSDAQAESSTGSFQRAEETTNTSPVPRTERTGHIGKYAALHRWLVDQDPQVSELRVSFGQLEDVLGFPLPDSSRNHLAHWYGYEGSAVARALADAGWKASQVNLTAETAMLQRVAAATGARRPPVRVDDPVTSTVAPDTRMPDSQQPPGAGAGAMLYGRSPSDWDALEDAGHAFLVEKARAAAYTNYTELSDELARRTGLRRFDFADASERAAVGHLLGRIAERDLPTSGSLLTAIVIYLHGNDAGAGFYNLAKQKGLLSSGASADQRLAFWVDQVKRVHSHHASGRH